MSARGTLDRFELSSDLTYPFLQQPGCSIVADAPNEKRPAPEVVAAVAAHGRRAWPEFLREYTPFMMSCIRRFATDTDERMEIYVHVCERLVADDCRRIRQFRGAGRLGACKFTTWLAAVVFNLSREWIRSERGRRRLFRSLQDLSRTNRLIFQYYFWDGYSRGQIASLLRLKNHISCEAPEVTQRLAEIERHLSRDHRWRLVTGLLRSSGPISIDRPRTVVGEGNGLEIPDRREGSGRWLEREDANERLHALINELPNDERLAVRLRFERGLSARDIAAALGIRNHKRVYEIQGRALAKLADGLRRQGLELRDFLKSRSNSFRVPR